MNTTHGGHTLVRHHDIQDWVGRHHGLPAIARIHNAYGESRSRLSLRFRGPVAPAANPSLDDGASPCSWTAWLAELDRQQLALRITDPNHPAYELVPRGQPN